MGRLGVTYEAVKKVAVKLVDLNKNPTVDNIRLELGTGSKTTILSHLRKWHTESSTKNLGHQLITDLSACPTSDIQTDFYDLEKVATNFMRVTHHWRREQESLKEEVLHARQLLAKALGKIAHLQEDKQSLLQERTELKNALKELANKLQNY